MFYRPLLTSLMFCALIGCGKPTVNNGSDGGVGSGSNSGGDASSATNNAGSTSDTGADACGDIGTRFTDAVRAIPRNCAVSADCKLLPRAQACDCDLAVSASSDTAEYEAVRAEADAAQCTNPFGCPTGECPYRRLSGSGDIYPYCNAEGQCETLQIMSCADYEARAHGGIASPGSCEVDADCALRNDLNPCDCNEAITVNFPFLSVQAIYEMIEINDSRCGISCMGCQAPGTAVCATDSEGRKYCATN